MKSVQISHSVSFLGGLKPFRFRTFAHLFIRHFLRPPLSHITHHLSPEFPSFSLLCFSLLTMNEVKEEPWISDIGYGRTEAGFMWAESKNDQASALYLDANFEKAFKIDDISSVFHYELIAKNDGLSSCMTGEENGECGVFDGLLCEDQVANLPLAVCLSNASEDQILDVNFAKKVPELDFKFCDDLSFGDSRSDIYSPGTSNEVVGVFESSIPVPRCLNNQDRKSTACEMHDVSRSRCGGKTPVEDEMGLKCSEDRMSVNCLLIRDRQDVHETNEEQCMHYGEVSPVNQCIEAEYLLTDGLSNNSCSEGKTVRARQRRLCKLPQKYMDGSLCSKSRRSRPRKSATSSLKDLGFSSQKNHHRKPSKRKTSKHVGRNLELDSDEEYKPRFDRRKNSKVWKLDEVVKLVDGITHFGQGQWTSIQRTFFPSSCRTPTDIRDKWRNLVKTNCRNLRIKREDGHLKSGSQSLPKPVIERVRELANTTPKCRSKREGKHSDSRHCDTCLSLPE